MPVEPSSGPRAAHQRQSAYARDDELAALRARLVEILKAPKASRPVPPSRAAAAAALPKPKPVIRIPDSQGSNVSNSIGEPDDEEEM